MERKGDIVMGTELSPEARDKLVATLHRLYPRYTPVQLSALVSKPKPLALIKGVEEARARNFIASLQAQGVMLQFEPVAAEAQGAISEQPLPVAQPSADMAQPTAQPPGPPPSAQPGADSYQSTAPTPAAAPPAQPAGPGFPDSAPAARQHNAAGYQPTAKPQAVAAPSRKVTMKFTGTAGEYFRIWIVNAALTIVTLGIYSAWAKVRTRRYFYSNTVLDGQPFDYTARPGTILKGHAIVGGTLVLINVLSKFTPIVGALVTAAAWCAVPFLLYKAHRFKARNSAYRNIRFRFLGDAMDAYKAYGFIPLFVILGLVMSLPALIEGPEGAAGPGVMAAATGIIGVMAGFLLMISFPVFIYLQKNYLHNNIGYGKTTSLFRGEAGRFYGIYIRAFLMLLALPFIGGILFAIFGAAAFSVGTEGAGGAAIVGFVILYGLFLLLATLVQQYIYASTFNYSWSNTRLGPITLDTSLSAKSLAWIRFTNVLAIIFSLGLMTPWAKVRRARYVLKHTAAVLPADMGTFQAAAETDEGAVGDTAADFFDWDIGW